MTSSSSCNSRFQRWTFVGLGAASCVWLGYKLGQLATRRQQEAENVALVDAFLDVAVAMKNGDEHKLQGTPSGDRVFTFIFGNGMRNPETRARLAALEELFVEGEEKASENESQK